MILFRNQESKYSDLGSACMTDKIFKEIVEEDGTEERSYGNILHDLGEYVKAYSRYRTDIFPPCETRHESEQKS